MITPKLTTAQRLDLAAEILLVRHYEENGEKLVRVPLSGKAGDGSYMVLEAEVWKEGRANGWPAKWKATRDRKSGRLYVRTCCKPMSPDGRAVPLARIIMNAGPDEVVSYMDGDTLNLRRSNLVKMARTDFMQLYYGRREIQEVAVYGEDIGAPF